MGISCKIACFTVSWMFLGVFGLWDVWCVGILVSVCVCIRMNVSVIIDVDAYRVIAMIISCAKLCHLFSECKCPNRSFSFSLCRGGKQGSAIPIYIYMQICLPKPNLLTLIRRWNFFLETESGEIEISLWKSQKLVNFTPLQQAAAGTQSMCSDGLLDTAGLAYSSWDVLHTRSLLQMKSWPWNLGEEHILHTSDGHKASFFHSFHCQQRQRCVRYR